MYKGTLKKSILSMIDMMKKEIIDKSLIISEGLLNSICFITSDTNREVAIFINRYGKIIDVIVGNFDSVSIVEYRETRALDKLSGIRCIHTHPNGDASFSDLDISALKKLKLDLLVSVGVYDNKIKESCIAFINQDEKLNGVTIQGPYNLAALLDVNALSMINQIEKEYNDKLEKSIEIFKEKESAILVGINGVEELDELNELLDTAGGIEIDRIAQNNAKINSSYYIGTGKLNELLQLTQAKNPDLIVFDEELSGAQVRNLEQKLGIKIIDRTQLILDIFAKHALSKEGKLQVELAQLKYALPRLIGYGLIMSRTGGGIGTRGPGETKLEVDRRRIRKRIHDLEKEIKQIKRQRDTQRKRRQQNVFHVSLVGYTNSGKSSLLNALSGSNISVRDKLFATLDPTSRGIKLNGGKEIVITDTVGFINKLPHDLVEAFKSTLEEALYADLLINVVDASNEDYEMHIDVVNSVLKSLGGENKPIVVAVNKIDKIKDEDRPFVPLSSFVKKVVYISAKEKKNLDILLDVIEDFATLDSKIVELILPYKEAHLVSLLHENGKVQKEEYIENGIFIRGEFAPIEIDKVREYLL